MFLHNRPKAFVLHCMEKLYSSEYAEEEDTVKRNDGAPGLVFHVKSSTDLKHYQVDFGDKERVARCTCPDFETHYWPCKHMFVVIRKNHASWSDLPEHYRKHPVCTLDPAVIRDDA